MKTNIHFLSYVAHFFLEWEMFRTKVVEKIKTPIFCSVTFFQKSCNLWGNVKKYHSVRQATEDCGACAFACWIRRSTNTHWEYVLLLLLFHCNNGCTNTPYFYITLALPVVLCVRLFPNLNCSTLSGFITCLFVVILSCILY